jgi:hypothetical protein
MASGREFVSTFFDDRKVFRLVDQPPTTTGPDPTAPLSVREPATWDLVRDFAIASGAFPLAFPPLLPPRLLTEYDIPDTIDTARGFTDRPERHQANSQPSVP